jgi:TetR/AcrR family acrAB operon transcriptional repressor
LARPPEEALAGLAAMAMLPLRELATQAQVQRVFSIAMHYTEYTADLAPVRQRNEESIATFVDQLETMLKRAHGRLRPKLNKRAAALGLFALVDGLMIHWTLSPQSFDLIKVGEQAVHSYLSGLQVD